VVVGGERRSDVARSYGYRGVSAIIQILKRLPDSAIGNKAVAARKDALATELKKALSTVILKALHGFSVRCLRGA
jgi:hypothetical protein